MYIKENKELYDLRKNIIEKAKDFSKEEIKNRKKMCQNALEKEMKKKLNQPKNLQDYFLINLIFIY